MEDNQHPRRNDGLEDTVIIFQDRAERGAPESGYQSSMPSGEVLYRPSRRTEDGRQPLAPRRTSFPVNRFETECDMNLAREGMSAQELVEGRKSEPRHGREHLMDNSPIREPDCNYRPLDQRNSDFLSEGMRTVAINRGELEDQPTRPDLPKRRRESDDASTDVPASDSMQVNQGSGHRGLIDYDQPRCSTETTSRASTPVVEPVKYSRPMTGTMWRRPDDMSRRDAQVQFQATSRTQVPVVPPRSNFMTQGAEAGNLRGIPLPQPGVGRSSTSQSQAIPQPRFDQPQWTPSAVGEPMTYVRQPLPPMQSSSYLAGRPSFTPDRYDGGIPWNDYMAHFESVADINGWTPVQKVAFLAASLKGSAQEVLSDAQAGGNRVRYHELVSLLEQRFGPGNRAELYVAELRGRRRKANESLQELGQAIRRLTGLAYPEMPRETRDRLARIHFQDAVQDRELRAGIFQARVATLDEAIRVALEIESFSESERLAEGGRRRHARAVQPKEEESELENLKKQIKELQRMLSKLQEQGLNPSGTETNDNLQPLLNGQPRPWRRRFDLSQIICYACGAGGHMARSCPNKKFNGFPQQSGN